MRLRRHRRVPAGRQPLLAVLLAATLVAAGCGPWRLVGDEHGPSPELVVPRIFDAPAAYRAMGLIAAPDPVPFVASIVFLAAPHPDSTLAVVGLSLANRALSFRRNGLQLEARYQVEIAFLRDSAVIQHIRRDELVQVGTVAETLRSDESVLFQRTTSLSPGPVRLRIIVRDLRRATSSQVEAGADVPSLARANVLSSLVPVYRASARTARTEAPDLALNPRATVTYGAEPLRFYLEGYGWPDGVRAVLRAVSEEEADAAPVWSDTIVLSPGPDVAGAIVTIPAGALPIGRVHVEAAAIGGGDTARSAALVAFSDQWVVANFEETLSLLRYFATAATLDRLRAAEPAERPQLWREFWSGSDPEPRTAEHEALVEYFGRLQTANDRFTERADPGWLTDRGEVFIALGEPEDIYDSSSDLQGRGGRWIRWVYTSLHVTLNFVDESGFGRFRLDGASRSMFMQVLERIRFSQ